MTFHPSLFGSIELPGLEEPRPAPGTAPDGVRIVRRPKAVRPGEVRS